jgi:hypothetical protein
MPLILRTARPVCEAGSVWRPIGIRD